MKELLLVGGLVLAAYSPGDSSHLDYYELGGVRIAALPKTIAEVDLVEPGKLYLDPVTQELRQQPPIPATVRSRYDLERRYLDWCVGSGADRDFCVCTVAEIGPLSHTAISDNELQFVLAVFALAPLPDSLGQYEDAADAIIIAGDKCARLVPLQK